MKFKDENGDEWELTDRMITVCERFGSGRIGKCCGECCKLPESVIITKLPKPDPMPEIRPGYRIKVVHDASAYCVTKVAGNLIQAWRNDWANERFVRENVRKIYDADGQLIWGDGRI